MKKICFILLGILFIFIASNAFAEVVTTRRIIQNPTNTNTIQKQNVTPKTSRLSSSVKMCKPYSESLNTNVAGVGFLFNIKILGWVNNKCRLDFIAQSTGLSEIFSSLYGVGDVSVQTFEPKIRCEFTKQQLVSVGDSILQEEERKHGAKNNMLKNPNDIDISSFMNMSNSDVGLMNILLNDRACNILNAPDSSKMFESLFGF